MAKKGFVPWNAGTSKTKVTIICENCGETVEKYLYGRKKVRFCSNKCAHEAMKNYCEGKTGKDHPRWNENKLTPFRKSLRHTYEYGEWREAIFTRDDYTSQSCGERGGVLEAHHIIPFATILNKQEIYSYQDAIMCDELWNIDNGITYCRECHIKHDICRERFNGGDKNE